MDNQSLRGISGLHLAQHNVAVSLYAFRPFLGATLFLVSDFAVAHLEDFPLDLLIRLFIGQE